MGYIGVTTGYGRRSGGNAVGGGSDSYQRAISMVGGRPVGLFTGGGPEEWERQLWDIDALLLTGGSDVHPSYYRHKPHPKLGYVNRERDAMEIHLAKRALEIGMPVLGVCRGMQLLNVAMGGTLYQDIPTQWPTKINHRDGFYFTNGVSTCMDHLIRVRPDTILREIVGDRQYVNTYHHQAVRSLADGLVISAVATDGIIEAIEGTGQNFIMGVQFHPEMLCHTQKLWLELFRRLERSI